MDPAKEMTAGVESAMQLLRKEMNRFMELCLNAEVEPKRVQGTSETDEIRENRIRSKEKELEERESKVAAMERSLVERQNGLDAKEKDHEEECKAHAEIAEFMRREYEVHLREKKLGDENEGKIMGVNVRIESPRDKPDSAIRTDSAEKQKVIQRKRSRKVLEIGESSIVPQASGTARDGHVQGGMSFLLNIMETHENKDIMTVPAYFVGAYDLSGKNQVILSTDEGDFCLEVKHYDDPRHNTSRHVVFRHGWREFYGKNRLGPGMQCFFKVKEHTVDGDASVFSMDVSVFGR